MANLRKDKKGRGLHTGEQQRKDGIYLYRYTDSMGNRKTIYAGDLPELRQKEKSILRNVMDGIRTDEEAQKLTLNDLFYMYIDTRMIADSTRLQYRNTWRVRVQDDIGREKVTQIRPATIKHFYAELDRASYHHNTIHIIHMLIYSALDIAVENDIIRKNPASKALYAKCGEKGENKTALTLEQQEKLFTFLKNSNCYNIYIPMFTILLETGLRCGEFVGLTWNDVSLEEKTLSVNHQLLYHNFGDGCTLYAAPPKTESGIRIIPMNDKALQAFKQQKELNACLNRTCIDVIDGYSDFIFLTRKGHPNTPVCMNRILYSISAAYNRVETRNAKRECREPELLPKFSMHDLRHTYCTNKVREGMNLKILQYLMGHKNVITTMDIYNHIDNIEDIRNEILKDSLSQKGTVEVQ